jgi:hypothetical protein
LLLAAAGRAERAVFAATGPRLLRDQNERARR